jgi:hypothetical protein
LLKRYRSFIIQSSLWLKQDQFLSRLTKLILLLRLHKMGQRVISISINELNSRVREDLVLEANSFTVVLPHREPNQLRKLTDLGPHQRTVKLRTNHVAT